MLVNYAARDAGIKRHLPVAEALLKCPQLRLVHVPTYSIASTQGDDDEIVALPKYSDEMPAYRADGTRLPPNPPDPASNKACLEPYRHASMAIFRLIRSWCSDLGDGNLVEKGGLDEAFVDITEEVEQQLIDQFAQKYVMIRDELAELEGEEVDSEALDNLAMYDTSWIDTDLDFTGLGESVDGGTEDVTTAPPDIIEVARMKLGKLRIWKGAQIAKTLRTALRQNLSFIASIGIAPNKMLAKLVSAHYKPDKQTRIEPQNIRGFMRRVPFEKIRMMGGKMGKSVLEGSSVDTSDDDSSDNEVDQHEDSTLKTVMASDLWPLTLAELSERVGDKSTALWIHHLIRGQDPSPVTPRCLTKSFMSAKSFRPAVRDWPELHDWVVVLVGELWSRVGEEREAGSGRWPSTITVQFKSYSPKQQQSTSWSNTGAVTKSCEFPFASTIPSQATRSHFLASTFKLLSAQPALFPMSRLAVSVTNFKGLEADGKAKATRVDQYFKKQLNGDEVYEIPAGLDRLFPKQTVTESVPPLKKSVSVFDMLVASAKPHTSSKQSTPESTPTTKKIKPSKQPKTKGILQFFTKPQTDTSSFSCKECKFSCDKEAERDIQEHLDYHLALKLSRE